MASARIPSLRKPDRRPRAFLAVIDDFLPRFDFEGSSILDIGPGQWDMLDIARARGAARTVGIDFDPAVCKLGLMRGHEAVNADLTEGWPLAGERFDGIFCRASINPYWFRDEALHRFLDGLAASAAPDGWIWIVPWNKPPQRADGDTIERVEAIVRAWGDRNAIRIRPPSPAEIKRYGIGYDLPLLALWHRT